MYKYDYLKVTSLKIKQELGNIKLNKEEILKNINNLTSALTVTNELALTGSSCYDFFNDINLKEEVNKEVKDLIKNNKYKGILILGTPLYLENNLYNTAVVIKDNKIECIAIKQKEDRWFKKTNKEEILFNNELVTITNKITLKNNNEYLNIKIEFDNTDEDYENVGLNIRLSDDKRLINDYIKEEITYKVNKYKLGFIYTSSSITTSTTINLLNNKQIIKDPINEKELKELTRDTTILNFDLDLRSLKNNKNTFKKIIEVKETETYELEDISLKKLTTTELENIKDILIESIIHRMKTINTNNTVLGLSGGLDSTFSLLILILAYKKYNIDLKNIHIYTLSTKESSARTKNNVLKLKEILKLNINEININDEVELVNNKINKENNNQVYENVQARIRTSLLMNISNKVNGICIGTSDMSEIALGFSTYNADNMGMYNLNANITKTHIREMVSYLSTNYFKEIKEVLDDILDTPISPELSKESIETEKVIGKYLINDFILYHKLYINSKNTRILYLLEKIFNLTKEESKLYLERFEKRFYQNQYKRQVLADSVLLDKVSISNRLNMITPSDYKRYK